MSGANVSRAALTAEDVRDAIDEANAVAAQTKCSCDVAIAVVDESVLRFDWYRCRMCFGLVSRIRLVEGTAHLRTGTLQ